MPIGPSPIKNYMKHLSKDHNKIGYLYLASIAVLLCSAVLGIVLGSTSLSVRTLLQALLQGQVDSAAGKILWYVRFPRVAGSLLCGAALAVSGATIQAVLANRLASPSIIGVNAGAGLAVTLCGAMGILGGWQFSLWAFAGAFCSVMMVSLGAKKWGASRGTVILMGVTMNALMGAFSDTIRTFVPEVSILSNNFRIGDFSAVTYTKLGPAAVIILVSFGILCSLTNELDVLTLGDDEAKSLGLNTGVMRTVFLMLAAAMAGAAVSIAGLLSFVGLLVPHTVRRVATSDTRHLIPLCAPFGAGFVTLCDTLARVIFAPYELPVGILMAFLGAPFFLFVLIKGKGGRSYA